jgi:hypothetical protein
MTEVRIVPRVRTETEVIHTPVSKCGDNWFKPVKIRSPYRGTDVAYRTLPSLGDPGQVEHFDTLFLEEIHGDHIRISTFIQAHASVLTARQQENVQTMLDRAARYLRDAATIARAWATGFATVSAGTVPAWPLGGQPRGPVNNLMEEGHARDQDKYKKLVRSALRNLRCAEEVSKKATIRERNKQRRPGRRFSKTGLGAMPGGPIPPPMPDPLDPEGTQMAEFDPIGDGTATIDAQSAEFQPIDTSLDDGELEDGDIVLDEEGEEEEGEEEIQEEPKPAPTKKAKKKDNTLLIAGAAALGIMALKGR